mmetsp:Transcript_3035/g.5319  ORF Transcript_3035/g.5319 Transcript_3035/m.5319 type:complete len:259 (+) Transcript_3035:38-814(+)
MAPPRWCRRGRHLVVFFGFAALFCFRSRERFQAFAVSDTTEAVSTLRQAAGLTGAKPPEDSVLQSLLSLQRKKTELNQETPYFEKLTGGQQEGGKRWRLVYLATRNAVVAARQGVKPPSPLDRGWYVDGLVTAVQRFENSTKKINQNGVYEFLGLGGFFFGYFARFKWPSPEKRTTMAFQPITNNLKAFGNDWSWPFAGDQGDEHFEAARLQDLNIFNFFYVDDMVAVAQGASGSVAVWGATDAEWDSQHLIPVEEAL